MPFKKFKEAHGGRGPLQEAYSAVTGETGLFGRLGLKEERAMTDDLISQLSSSDEFKGLAGMIEVGRSPLTREQHAQFRAGLTQAAIDVQAFNAGMAEFADRMTDARRTIVSKEDGQILDNFQTLANHAQRLSASGHMDKAESIFGSVLENFGAYVQRNEEQRLEIESSDAAGRETIRKELQGVYNQHILAPTLEDEANFGSIMAQLETGDPTANATNAQTSAVLEYVGAQLRGSDDGNWSFRLGPLGLGDAAVPTMTYSQLRNAMVAARRGRRQALDGAAQELSKRAELQGFGINGSRIGDLIFPLADAHFSRLEQESTPAAPTAKDVMATGTKIGEGIRNVFVGGGQAVRSMLGMGEPYQDDKGNQYELIDRGEGRKEWRAVGERLPVNGDPPPRNPRAADKLGQINGVYVPPPLRGLFQ